MEQEWTLKGELERRGMTLVQAAKACGMDYATMGILYGGGKTLPRLALKVAKGLRLTREQAKKLGQPLDRKVWLKVGNGLPRPNPLDMSPTWYERIREDGNVGGAVQARPIWLDIEGVARWMWENQRMDVGKWISENGCAERAVNNIATDAVRTAAIERVERKWGIPPEVAETRYCMKNMILKARWSLDQNLVSKRLYEKRMSRGDVVTEWKERYGLKGRNTEKNVYRLLRNGDRGGISLQSAGRMCEILGLDMHNDVEMIITVSAAKGTESL